MIKLYKQIWFKSKEYVIAIIAICILTLIQVITQLKLPDLMSEIIDVGILQQQTDLIWSTGGSMLLVSLLSSTCTIIVSLLAAKTAVGFSRDLRLRLFNKVENYSLREFDKIGTASLINRNTNDVSQVERVSVMGLRMVIAAPLTGIGGIIMAVQKDVTLTLVLAVSLPILAVAIILIAKKGIPYFTILQTKLDKVNLVLRENLTGIRVIRAFNNEKAEQKRFDGANEDLTQTAIKVNRIFAVVFPLIMVVVNITTVGVIWFGAKRIDAGLIGIGDMMATMQYIMQIMFSLLMVSMMFIMFPRAEASAKRINEVLDIDFEITDNENPVVETELEGYVEFKNVSFYYYGAEEPALRNISFSAKPGETTAIIGGTGAGKSTLLNMIPRFYDVSEGEILVDGVNVKDLSQEALRKKIGFVPQKIVLFNGSVNENIKYGKDDATQEEIEEAIEIAQAKDFVENLEKKYESHISQGGTNLSGGQRQRISIARALVRNPEIYIFDDSFSALDYKTDALLRKSLKKCTENSTLLIVAQRVSTVMNADRIIVLDDGKAVGMGTHKELLNTCEVYKEIVHSQLSEEELA